MRAFLLKYSLSLRKCLLFSTIKSFTISDAFWYFSDSLFKTMKLSFLQIKMQNSFGTRYVHSILTHSLSYSLSNVCSRKKRIRVGKYIRETINNEQRVIKTDIFQTIVASIRQEISLFNLH